MSIRYSQVLHKFDDEKNKRPGIENLVYYWRLHN